ncbi:hypothetical protein Ab1vBOLIVR2_gp02 [Agrobacterium phage OLIVR2]|uniref:Uncharacterized protein n=1 Tax=Agrobacterium phage OLIVR1 TaxID=2723769 RepID=A0A858MQY4_9CAUD|nr:hypothetical protein [Xanthomonas campestris]YP_010107036.1 hypothetical protein KNU98_gp107 [Agrobacterium phage OLIVR1]QIW87305.1 hypothetical protein Ab1vBOLIVR2_gp02 [Agrobacterium phage OLIVR2]QIW87412.1 hypothetical protein Ab1vBOLIVR3_gp02 [Agrobacterium phage OLIVR3]MCF8861608.1 hypothetical protein [Xanthomonas campestris pv. campestris]QIW87197.1 hypothetical protein Ab1vBOLIVR1_gp02 [Agrobacterium phage OLIVR1]
MKLFDPYGSLSAAMTGIEVHEKLSRGSGRTQTMLAAAEDTGGVIICTQQAYDGIVRRINSVNRRNDRVRVLVVDPTKPEDIYRKVRHGPIYFDHQWMLEVHEYLIVRTSDLFFQMVQMMPSPDYKHRFDGPTFSSAFLNNLTP